MLSQPIDFYPPSDMTDAEEIAARYRAASAHPAAVASGDMTDIPKPQIEKEPKAEYEPYRTIGIAFTKDSKLHDALGKLSRYETALMNALNRTLHQLYLLKALEGNSSQSLPK